jgi:hypothetical protein
MSLDQPPQRHERFNENTGADGASDARNNLLKDFWGDADIHFLNQANTAIGSTLDRRKEIPDKSKDNDVLEFANVFLGVKEVAGRHGQENLENGEEAKRAAAGRGSGPSLVFDNIYTQSAIAGADQHFDKLVKAA